VDSYLSEVDGQWSQCWVAAYVVTLPAGKGGKGEGSWWTWEGLSNYYYLLLHMQSLRIMLPANPGTKCTRKQATYDEDSVLCNRCGWC